MSWPFSILELVDVEVERLLLIEDLDGGDRELGRHPGDAPFQDQVESAFILGAISRAGTWHAYTRRGQAGYSAYS